MTATAKTAPRHAELLDVAISLFYEKGYAHTTLQDIADRMGFTKAAVYYYAKNKEELLVEIYTAIVRPAIDHARELADTPDLDGATLFLALVENHLRTFLRNIEANAVFEVQNHSLSPEGKQRIEQLAREYNAVLRRVYEDGVADGTLAPGDATIAVNAVIGMCNSAHRWFRPRGRFGVSQVIGQLMAIVSAGVRPAGS